MFSEMSGIANLPNLLGIHMIYTSSPHYTTLLNHRYIAIHKL